MTRIALIHAVAIAMRPINDAFMELWPEAGCVNLLDDSLAIDRGSSADVPQAMFERFHALVRYADGIGASGILFTCSAFGPAIEAARAATAAPVLKPNEAMFEAALDTGLRIGMLSTFAPSNPPMEAEFRALAATRGSPATLTTLTVPDARAAMQAGDVVTHNRLLAEAAERFDACDVIMLGQFSTAPALAEVQRRTDARVLTAPGSAVTRLRSRLAV